jgi:hypothetical protein
MILDAVVGAFRLPDLGHILGAAWNGPWFAIREYTAL